MAATVDQNPKLDEDMPETPRSIAPANPSSVVDLEKIGPPEEPVRNVHGFKVHDAPDSS